MRVLSKCKKTRGKVVGLGRFELPTHGLGNHFLWNPLFCHKSSSQLRHKQLFRRPAAWRERVSCSLFCKVPKRQIDMPQAHGGRGCQQAA